MLILRIKTHFYSYFVFCFVRLHLNLLCFLYLLTSLLLVLSLSLSAGSYIFSDNPVAVVVGTRSMPVQSGSLLHFSEQLTPVPLWGTEFVVRGFQTEYGCIIHITSSARRTIVEMTGFRTVEMSGNGQTLKRRIEDSEVSYIKTKKPVQVMMYVGFTYASYADIQSVGMTLIPAMRHFQTSYVVSCCGRSALFQYVLMNGDFVHGQGHHDITVTKVISSYLYSCAVCTSWWGFIENVQEKNQM